MSKSSNRYSAGPLRWWQELRDGINLELFGLLVFCLGGLFLISLIGSSDPYSRGLPWLTGMVGWTAPWLVLALFIVGSVLMLGSRAGYWSIEALVGAEALLVALQMSTFLWNNEQPTWTPQIDGGNGGLVGVTLGSLLLAGLGRWPALVIVALIGLVGLGLLLRYTPLFYGVLYLAQRLPWLVLFWPRRHGQGYARQNQEMINASTKPPLTASNFVSAQQPLSPDSALVGETEDRPPSRPAKSRKRVADPPAAPAPLPPIEGQTSSQTPAAPAKRSNKSAVAKTQLPPAPAMGDAHSLPGLDLLNPDKGAAQPLDVRVMQQLIEATLADFNVPVRTVHVESGPTVTQFGVEPLYLERAGQKRKVRVSRIVNLADDLSLALAVPAVRIEAPVPGRPYVGIEVPNAEKVMVTLRGIMESKTMAHDGGKLALPLGRNTAGAPVVMDLARAPHMLIAGATGAGKSVCINTIVTGLLMQHGPDRLRFVMVDPKMVELPGYNGIPHLLGKVITEMDQVMGALTWLLLQMDDRYRLFQQAGVRNIEAYNALVGKQRKGENALQSLPFIVLIIDELADLMMTAAEDVERQICRLAQMARATGIHLILATQRPSIDVVTGLIKANFPSRIAFAVTSQIDSRVILDTPGAERLLGRGDMLLMRPDMAKLLRVQGCFVADEEISRVVNFWKNQRPDPESSAPPPWSALLDRLEDEDEMLHEALDAIQGLTTITTSQLQRKLHVGYPKAARLMEQLAAKGAVGPDQGNGQGRPVLPRQPGQSASANGDEADEV